MQRKLRPTRVDEEVYRNYERSAGTVGPLGLSAFENSKNPDERHGVLSQLGPEEEDEDEDGDEGCVESLLRQFVVECLARREHRR